MKVNFNLLIELKITIIISYIVDVPGCEPYREYLYTYLREQPIWQSLRFWNAAFFDALQCERIHRPVPPSNCQSINPKQDQVSLKSQDGISTAASSPIEQDDNNADILKEDQQFHQNISFGQLGYGFFFFTFVQ